MSVYRDRYSLRGLNLENTKLGDNAAMLLCKQLTDHPRLKEINLSKNHITDLSCESIAQLVGETFYLASLTLHWNLITYLLGEINRTS